MSNRIGADWSAPGDVPARTKAVNHRLRARLFAALALGNLALWGGAVLVVWRTTRG